MITENMTVKKISEDEIAKAGESLASLQKILSPYLLTISKNERKQLPKMSERNLPFVKKIMEYSGIHPEMAPGFVNAAELKNDVDMFESLAALGRNLKELAVAMEDTAIVAGSVAYSAALSFYNSVKHAVKMNIPGAKVLLDDLSIRFEKNGNKAVKTKPEIT